MTLYMPLFRSCSTLRTLTQLHAHLMVTGLHRDLQPATRLIESYSQVGSLHSSNLIFHNFQDLDSFMWGVLIKCHVRSHLFSEAILLYHEMCWSGTQVGNFVFPPVLKACGGFGDLGIGGKMHGRILKSGFGSDGVVETSLVGMYGELGCLSNARKVFDDMLVRDLVSWSSIISSCVDNGEASEGLDMFRLLLQEGFELDSVTLIGVAEACGELGVVNLGRSLHGYILRKGIRLFESLGNSMVVMYSKFGDLLGVERVFENVAYRSVTSWTAMISSYNRTGLFRKSLAIFLEMSALRIEPNLVTMMGIVGSCRGLSWLREGKSVHCYVLKKDAELGYDCLGSAFIELYADFGQVAYCEKVLHTMGKYDIVSWNMLMAIYAREGLLKEAIALLMQMQKQGLMPDSFSLSSSLTACGEVGLLHLGRQIHGHAIKRHVLTEFVQNSLIDMYSKCGFVNAAYSIFVEIQAKSLVTWNCMICGYSQNGNSSESLMIFDHMYLNNLEMNEVTFLGAIQACSTLGHLEKAKWLHHKLITCGAKKNLQVDTALVDMYAKCGDLRRARQIFDMMLERNVVSWSVMIGGYGMHGHVDDAISIFSQMTQSGIKPNGVTFMNILSACSHSGYLEEGKYYFGLMRDLNVNPSSEHFACMVDLLSRAGDLSRAHEIIKSMPFPVGASIWAALLNGCRIHHRMDMIRSIERDLLHMNTDDCGYYTLLSNIYAEEGNWDGFRKVRSLMEGTSLTKVPGYSAVELDKKVYRFGAGDASRGQMEEIYTILQKVHRFDQEPEYNVDTECPFNKICVLPTFMNDNQEPGIEYLTAVGALPSNLKQLRAVTQSLLTRINHKTKSGSWARRWSHKSA